MRRRGLTLLELLVVLTILIALATIVVPVISTFGRKSQDVATRENLLRLQDLLVNQYWPDMGELPRPKNLTGPPVRLDRPQLRYLFVNPDTEDTSKTTGATLLSTRRWNGPYVRHTGARYQIDNSSDTVVKWPRGFIADYGLGDDTGIQGDPAILDAWGRPIVIQVPSTGASDDWKYARLVSAGPDGVIETQVNVRMPDDSPLPTYAAGGSLETYTGRGDDILIFLFRHDEFGPDFLKLEP